MQPDARAHRTSARKASLELQLSEPVPHRPAPLASPFPSPRMLIDGGGGPAARPAPIPRFRKTKLMVRQLHPPVVLLVLLAVAGYGQTPQPPAAGYSRIYILLKPAVAEPGAARDAFAQRLAAFGVIN